MKDLTQHDSTQQSILQARVVVNAVTDEMLDRAAIVRFGAVTPKDFVVNYRGPFVKLVKASMGVKKSGDVVILGVQSEASSRRRRPKREVRGLIYQIKEYR